MNRQEGIINTGSGDPDLEIRKTRSEFTGVDSSIRRIRAINGQRIEEARAQSGAEIREAIRLYVEPVRGELSQATFPLHVAVRHGSGYGFSFDTTTWTVLFDGAIRSFSADEPFLADNLWFQHGERIIEEIGNTLMMLRAHTNEPLRISGK